MPVLDIKYRQNGKAVRRNAKTVLIVSRSFAEGAFNEPWLLCQLRYQVEPVWGMSTSVWATVWAARVEDLAGLTADEILARFPVDRRRLDKCSLCEIQDKALRLISSDLKRGLETWNKWIADQAN